MSRSHPGDRSLQEMLTSLPAIHRGRPEMLTDQRERRTDLLAMSIDLPERLTSLLVAFTDRQNQRAQLQ